MARSATRRKTAKPKKAPIGKSEGTKAHHFAKGNVMNPRGRPKGATNKVTRDLKEGIIQAAIEVGMDKKGKEGLLGYLKMLAMKHPKQYAGLLSRVMPLQITGNVGAVIGQVNIVSVPVDSYLSPAEAKRLTAPEPDIVDAEFVEEPTIDEEVA